MKPHVRKYKHKSLSAYFEHERKQYNGVGASRYTVTTKRLDTHGRLGARMGVSETTIARIVAGLNDPSFQLAVKISQDVDCPADAMGKSGVR
jgi:DNA-binding XRE family transcriptional regulator